MKWIPALLLCVILLLAPPVLAADAGSDRFTDWDEIQYQSEVAMLTDLGLLTGYSDGSFLPLNTITRAEIAKLLTSLLTSEPPAGEGAAIFTDTTGHWAEPYINYCAAAGVITGQGDGAFQPANNITGRELAKMLLVILGYPRERYWGTPWADNVDADAQSAGIYADFDKNPALYLSRDEACLLIRNALSCGVIAGYGIDGSPIYITNDMLEPVSLLQHRYDITPVSGMLQANAAADLRAAGERLEDGLFHIEGYARDFRVDDAVSRDASLLGHRVVVYARFDPGVNSTFGLPRIDPAEQQFLCDSFAMLQEIVLHSPVELSERTEYYVNHRVVTQKEFEEAAGDRPFLLLDHETDGHLDVVLAEWPS